MREALLEAIGVGQEYPIAGSRRRVHALNGVTLALVPGQTLGIVGESGCGKSTLARLLVGLEQPGYGQILYNGADVRTLTGSALRQYRRGVQMVFQDPYSALNPRLAAGQTLDEVLFVHALAGTARSRRQRVHELLDMVGLDAGFAGRYPHELSGGQRQRVGIARALAVEPRLLLLDEPVSALDVSVRAEIMNLLARLRDELGLGYLFISHDVAMVRHLSDLVGVMYLGRLVELGSWQGVLDQPQHPYTQALKDAVPVPDPRLATTIDVVVRGEVPDPARLPVGCPFHPRCAHVERICRDLRPELTAVTNGHTVACHVAVRHSDHAV
jgi:oligopeptide/dipeptide ABC transporter ATP-binding protein